MALSEPLLRPSRLPLVFGALITVGALLALHRLPAPEAPLGRGVMAVQDVAVFDPKTKSRLEHQDLLWVNGRIRRLQVSGDALPNGTTIISGKGLTALPSFCDAAVFLSLEGLYPQNSVPADPTQSLQHQLSGGVTALLDLNAHRTFMEKTRQAIENSTQPWPRLRFAGALFAAPGGWRVGGQTPWDTHVAEISELEDLQASWPLHLRFRDQAVFASVEHEGRDTLAIPLPVLIRLGELAHAQGVPFIVHAQHAKKALEALAAKPDAILGPMLTDEGVPALAMKMKHLGCYYLPALGTVLNGWPTAPSMAHWSDLGAIESQGSALLARAQDSELSATWMKHFSRQDLDRKAILRALLDIYLAQVPLALGTGSGLPLVFHGPGRQSEFELWQEAGVPINEILKAATLNSHRLLNIEGGSVQIGQRADLILVQGDPLRDPPTMRKIVATYIGGQEVTKP